MPAGLDMWAMGEGKRIMDHRMTYLAMTLSLIAFFPPRLSSQDIKNTNPTKEVLSRKVKGPSHKGASPAAQRSYPAPAETSRSLKISESETRVREMESAEQFMQLKDQVNADLIRLEDGKNADPVPSIGHAQKSDFHAAGKTKASSGNHIKESRAQIMGEAPPAPTKSAAGSNNK
ncbi:MAG: hypothetical protein ACYDA9_01555 [Terriglobia bacterium]